MRAYIDSDVLIWHLRGEKKASQFLTSIQEMREYELWIGVMQRAEIVFFMRPEEEPKTHLLLSQFKTEPLSANIVDHASLLYRRFHPSHGIDINDAMLAATVMHTGGRLYCLNTKHYPMPDLLVTRAWSR